MYSNPTLGHELARERRCRAVRGAAIARKRKSRWRRTGASVLTAILGLFFA